MGIYGFCFGKYDSSGDARLSSGADVNGEIEGVGSILPAISRGIETLVRMQNIV